MSEKIKLRDGDTMLIMVRDGEVIHFTANMSLPHVDFVRQTTGQLPEGAWVGSVSKLDGEIAATGLGMRFGPRGVGFSVSSRASRCIRWHTVRRSVSHSARSSRLVSSCVLIGPCL